MTINELSTEQLQNRQVELEASYQQFKAANLSLDLTRGKPGAAQLDLSNELDGILQGFYLLQDGTDVRNYGGILGIKEARDFGAEVLELDASEVMVGGNSSLTLMYLFIDQMMPLWRAEASATNSTIKFLCIVPGYDRHFTICEHFGIEMINIQMLESGPDMDSIEALLAADPMIKGIWCVPKYSNPTGQTYSADTVKRFARLAKIAGDNFRVMWDNAYVVHCLTDAPARLENLMGHAKSEQGGAEDSVVMFASTSKITFAGAGIAFVGTSVSNLSKFEKFLGPQMIGFDKVNQLRHVRFLKNKETLAEHMAKHRALLKPKFDLVEEKLQQGLKGKGVATWTKPEGGYFVSVDTAAGLARKVISLAADIGVKLTPAGATFPYGNDPENSNIRVAPTLPPIEELSKAMDVFVVCVELAAVNQLLA